MAENGSKKFNLITLTIILMIIFNIFYLLGAFVPSFLPGIIKPVFQVFMRNSGMLGLLEGLGAAALFVDLVGAWDRREKKQRNRQTFLVIILVLLFVYKFALRIFDGLLPVFT
jgi:hypothetical protein